MNNLRITEEKPIDCVDGKKKLIQKLIKAGGIIDDGMNIKTFVLAEKRTPPNYDNWVRSFRKAKEIKMV